MGFEGLLQLIAEEFSKARIRYALIGGLALHATGYSRATGDVDLLIHGEDVSKAKEILLKKGYTVISETQDALNLASPWQLISGIDFIKAHRRYALAMLERAVVREVNSGVRIPVAVPEDIIGLKVQAMANDPSRAGRDRADIEWLIHHAQTPLNMVLVQEYFDLFAMSEDLKKLLKEDRPC